MSQLLTAKRICEEALGAIGEFPVTDSGADGEKLRRAMTWLDLNLGQLAGTTRLFNLIPDTLSVTLTNGTTEYDLSSALGADLPVDRVQFPVNAWIENSAGNRTPVEIVTRDKIEAVTNGAESGDICMVYIDRKPKNVKLRLYRTPAVSDTATYYLKLVVQTYAPNVAPGGVTGTTPSGSVEHGFRVSWQRWLILQLSIDLGGGPVIKLPQSSLDNWRREAKEAKAALEAFENREHESTPPIVEDSDASYYESADFTHGGRF